ncbi:MAG: hypothetical protein M3Y54_21000 [Bacteroidota bacterium]|nr:hypothetical protein [Bacteroidota bacterium]
MSSLNTRSRQAEGALLAGYDLTKGHNRAYAAAGLGYVAGRKLGEYRYTIHGNSIIEQTHYYAYTQYQALGLPLEIGAMHSFPRARLALGLSLQANLNPDQSQYCLLFSMWFGKRGLAHLAP